jgi:hypothetical protein
MKKKKEPVNQDLRNEVLSIIDKLYTEFGHIDRNSNYISLPIIESIILDYCSENCELGFIFDNKVHPHLKKLSENERLQAVKNLLTDGYIDIKKERIHMMFMPYLNYDEKIERRKKYYITEVTL